MDWKNIDWKHTVSQAQARNGLTQMSLAKLAGCSQACIGDLMHGRTREPRFSLGQRLLELANSDAADLAGVTRPVSKADQAAQEI